MFLVKNKVQLKVPFIVQTKTSGNCGPCSIKMLLDYHQSPHFSVQSINKQVKVSKLWGCEEDDIWDFLQKHHYSPKKIKFSDLEKNLANGKPVLALFQDELHDGHYGLVVGFDQEHFIFHDPWPEFGANFKRKKSLFKKQAKVFDNWLVVLDI